MALRLSERLVASVLAIVAAGCAADDRVRPITAESSAQQPVVRATIPVGEKDDIIRAVAAEPGAVWVAATGNCSGSISRISPKRNRVRATIPTPIVYDLAVGAGAVWAVGEVCRRGPVLLRIDRRTNRVVARIPLARRSGVRSRDYAPSGVAAAGGQVWAAIGSSPRNGEVLQVHPHTNEVVDRISLRGQTGEIAIGAQAVWVLSHPEYTDETHRATALRRIDPATGRLSTPLRDKRLLLGGIIFPPLIATGKDRAWIHALGGADGSGAAPARIDARTRKVLRKPLDIDRFFPVAVAEGGVWFVGPENALSRLRPRTSNVDRSTGPLDLLAVSDAAFEHSSRSFWISGTRGPVIRIDLR